MNDWSIRAAHAARLRELVSALEVDGGDAVTVLLGMAERLKLGVDRYGPLDLDAPHDWQAEEDEERADIANYQAIRRMVARRGRQTRSAQRRSSTLAELRDAVPEEQEEQAASLVANLEAVHAETQPASVEDAGDPTWVGEGPRLTRERLARRGTK